MTTPRITCMNCGAALTPGGPVCCPKPKSTDPDLTTLVDAVAADVWEQQKDTLWADVPPALQHSTREAVLPFVVATLRHLDEGVAK